MAGLSLGDRRRGAGGCGEAAEAATVGVVSVDHRIQWIVFASVAGLVLAADQTTKAIVRATLGLGEARPGVGPFSIHHVRNSGILGGHLEGSALPMAAVTAVALAALVVYLVRRRHESIVSIVGFALLLGGGLGNLVDRLRLGYVTDFIDRGGDGAFNVADVCVTLGLITVLAAFLLRGREAGPTLDARPDAATRD
jgi:signal peptidase II